MVKTKQLRSKEDCGKLVNTVLITLKTLTATARRRREAGAGAGGREDLTISYENNHAHCTFFLHFSSFSPHYSVVKQFRLDQRAACFARASFSLLPSTFTPPSTLFPRFLCNFATSPDLRVSDNNYYVKDSPARSSFFSALTPPPSLYSPSPSLYYFITLYRTKLRTSFYLSIH